MARRPAKLSVAVGNLWPDELKVLSETSDLAKVAFLLAVGAGVIVAVFAGFALVQGDKALQGKIFSLAERVILIAVGWIGGHSGKDEKRRQKNPDLTRRDAGVLRPPRKTRRVSRGREQGQRDPPGPPALRIHSEAAPRRRKLQGRSGRQGGEDRLLRAPPGQLS